MESYGEMEMNREVKHIGEGEECDDEGVDVIPQEMNTVFWYK